MGAAVKPDVNFRRICAACEGNGWKKSTVSHGQGAGETIRMKCKDCGGTGRQD